MRFLMKLIQKFKKKQTKISITNESSCPKKNKYKEIEETNKRIEKIMESKKGHMLFQKDLVMNKPADLQFREMNYWEFKKFRDLEGTLTEQELKNYVKDSDTFFIENVFNKEGMMLGFFANDELVAVSVSTKLGSIENYKIIGDAFKESGIKIDGSTVFFNNSIVRWDFRGKSLQFRLREKTIDLYRRKNLETSFMVTVKKENKALRRNVEKLGMKSIGFNKVPYSDSLRELFYLEK